MIFNINNTLNSLCYYNEPLSNVLDTKQNFRMRLFDPIHESYKLILLSKIESLTVSDSSKVKQLVLDVYLSPRICANTEKRIVVVLEKKLWLTDLSQIKLDSNPVSSISFKSISSRKLLNLVVGS